MRRRGNQPWFHDFARHIKFERGAQLARPSPRRIKRGKGRRADVGYEVEFAVPGYEARQVTILFRNLGAIGIPRIYADGPDRSPHRYQGGTLCVWEPDDPLERRWIPDDGLRVLLDMVAIHLFKEAWWRETGEWLGDEHLHEPEKGRSE